MAYPQFYSIPHTLSLVFFAAGRGLLDSFRWDIVVSTIAHDVEVRTNVLKSLLLNALSLASIYTFDFLLLFIFPHGQQEQQWLHRNIGWFYNILWVLPVVGVSLYLNVCLPSFFLRYSSALLMRRTEYLVTYHSEAQLQPPAWFKEPPL
jgi:etoposide-induced 2.4 mRNA